MKPLELTVYPPIPPMPIGKWEIEERRMWWQDRADELDDRDAKRLTDAELAAEAWAAQCNRRVRNYDPTQDIPGVTWEWEHNIMARFATLPHYNEVDR